MYLRNIYIAAVGIWDYIILYSYVLVYTVYMYMYVNCWFMQLYLHVFS